MTDPAPITTVAEFSALVGVCERTIDRWIAGHDMPHYVQARRRYIPTLQAVLWILSRYAFRRECNTGKMNVLQVWAYVCSEVVHHTSSALAANRELKRTVATLEESVRVQAKVIAKLQADVSDAKAYERWVAAQQDARA